MTYTPPMTSRRSKMPHAWVARLPPAFRIWLVAPPDRVSSHTPGSWNTALRGCPATLFGPEIWSSGRGCSAPDAQLLPDTPPNQGRIDGERALFHRPLHTTCQRIADAAGLIAYDQWGHEVPPQAVGLLPVARNKDARGSER